MTVAQSLLCIDKINGQNDISIFSWTSRENMTKKKISSAHLYFPKEIFTSCFHASV